MKKAIVFYGSMRELEMGSKSWHILGEDADYFLVTWDCVNVFREIGTSWPDQPYVHHPGWHSYPFSLSTFPIPVKASIIIDYEKHIEFLKNKGLSAASQLLILYLWSLVKQLPDITSYDTVVMTRTDLAFFSTETWNQTASPGKLSFSGNDDQGINDWVIITDSNGLDTLSDLYNQSLNTLNILDKDNQYKSIHLYILERIKENPHKFDFPSHKLDHLIFFIIRPNYPKHWITLPYGPEFARNVINHVIKYEECYFGYTSSISSVDSLLERIRFSNQ